MAVDIIHGTGYRIGQSDRVIGDPAPGHEEGFVVLNQQNNKVFKVVGGVWTDGGVYPNANFTAQYFSDWVNLS